MKSLRTDDILGAMPRVRHMPKNLYREHQSYPYRHSLEDLPIKDYESYDKNIGAKWDHSYNENIYGNFPLRQYDPNPLIEKPIVPNLKRTRYNQKSDQQINMSLEYRDSEYHSIHERSQSKKQDQNKFQVRNQPQSHYIKPKQAKFINYDQLKHFNNISKDQKIYDQRKQLQDFAKKPESPRNSLQISNQNPKNEMDPQLKNINSNQEMSNFRQNMQMAAQKQKGQHRQSHSQRTSQSKEKVQRNIFRGLGFNIITNSKYLYNVQSTKPYSKRQN